MASGYLRINPDDLKKVSIESEGVVTCVNQLKKPCDLFADPLDPVYNKTVLLDVGIYYDSAGDAIVNTYPVFLTAAGNFMDFTSDSSVFTDYKIAIFPLGYYSEYTFHDYAIVFDKLVPEN